MNSECMPQAYYNEHDPRAAAWLRELIAEGHIAPGVVDTRSILEVRPHELAGYAQVHLFAGIGGWSLALRLAGVPDSAEVWTGSCPCQPFSTAGQGLAEKDPRHLWPHFRDLLAFGRPPIAFGEQVASALGRLWLARVLADLEGLGFAGAAADLCAAGLGAPHIRQRLYWVAYHARAERERRIGLRHPTRRAGFADDRFAGGLPHAASARCDRPERGAESEARDEAWLRLPGAHFDARRLEHDPGDGWQPRRPESDGRSVAGGCGDGAIGLGHPGEPGSGRHARAIPGPEGEGAGAGEWDRSFAHFPLAAEPWRRCDLLPFRDGKARRVEAGTFPLAHGVPGRVGLLRGYGNAIVPQVAAEFVGAAMETIANAASERPPRSTNETTQDASGGSLR